MRRARRHFSPADKVVILKSHLLDKKPVSDLCDTHEIYPTQFYDWLKQFFEHGHAAFESDRSAKADEQVKDRKIEALEAKLVRKDSVMAELLEAHTLLKKELGET